MMLTEDYINTLDIDVSTLDQTINDIKDFAEDLSHRTFKQSEVTKFLETLARRPAALIQEISSKSGHRNFESTIVPGFHIVTIGHGYKDEPCRGRVKDKYIIEPLKNHVADLERIKEIKSREIQNPLSRMSYLFAEPKHDKKIEAYPAHRIR
jgi:hypothetical protein